MRLLYDALFTFQLLADIHPALGSGGCFQLLQGQLDGGVAVAHCRVDGIKLAQALVQIDRHALVHPKGAHAAGCMTHIGLHLIVGDHFSLDVEQALVFVVVQLCRTLGDDEHRIFALQNLNALVDTVRHEIIERYRPGEDDPHLKVLQAAHISDDEYFSHMVRDDLSLIIRDIREAHKKDSESAPQTTVADELKENLEAVENFKGSRDEKLVVLYCKQLGINYKNLSDEEFRWLIRILKKSKKMGTPISQRKKR